METLPSSRPLQAWITFSFNYPVSSKSCRKCYASFKNMGLSGGKKKLKFRLFTYREWKRWGKFSAVSLTWWYVFVTVCAPCWCAGVVKGVILGDGVFLLLLFLFFVSVYRPPSVFIWRVYCGSSSAVTVWLSAVSVKRKWERGRLNVKLISPAPSPLPSAVTRTGNPL